MHDLERMRDSILEKLTEIDEVFESISDASSGGKRRLANELVSKFEDDWKPVAEQLVSGMDTFEDDKLAGVFTGLVRELNRVYNEKVSTYLDKVVEDQPKVEAPVISEEDKKKLSATRTDLYTQLKKVRELAESFDIIETKDDDPDYVDPNWVLPKARRGGFGKRGKRALSYYTWFIDGTEVAEDENSVKGVSELLGFEKVKDFTQTIRDAKVNTTKPPAEFELTINGKTVSAVRDEGAPINDDEPTDPADSDEDSDDED